MKTLRQVLRDYVPPEEPAVDENTDRLLREAQDIIAALAGLRAEVEVLEGKRNELVRQLSEAGLSNPQIGKALGMSTSNVRWIVGRQGG